MKKIFLLLAGLLFAASCSQKEVTAQVYKINGGYAYKVIYKDRTLINQSAIPSVPGNKKFCDSLDAVKVSNEVIKLIKSRKTPTITKDDLSRLKIKLKC